MSNEAGPVSPGEKQPVRLGAYTAQVSLFLMPDGVYRIDGRLVPGADHAAAGVDNGQLVVGVHDAMNDGEGLGGASLDAEKSENWN